MIKKVLYFSVFLFLCVNKISAKDGTKEFELITPPDLKVENNYKSIEFIDSRSFNRYLGFVQTSIVNSYTPVVDKTPFSKQIQKAFSDLTDKTIGNNTLVFQLRRLYFSEVTKSTNETGYCHVRYNLYSKQGEKYQYINTLDTIVQIKAFDVTQKLLNKSSDVIITHLAKSLSVQPSDTMLYSEVDILNIHYLEKHKKKLYGVEPLKNGVYVDYDSFANQTPLEYEISPQFKENKIISFTAKDIRSRKEIDLKSKTIYAIVVDNKAYIANYKSYIPLFLKNGEYCFINKGTIKESKFFPTYPIVIKKRKLDNIFYWGNQPISEDKIPTDSIMMQIDHLTGEFIPSPENASINYYIK